MLFYCCNRLIVSRLLFSLELSPLESWNTVSTFTAVFRDLTLYPDDVNHNFCSDRKSTRLVSRETFIFQRVNFSSVERALLWLSEQWNGPEKIITVSYICIKIKKTVQNSRMSIVPMNIAHTYCSRWPSNCIYRRVKYHVIDELLQVYILCIFRIKIFVHMDKKYKSSYLSISTLNS